MKTEKIEYRFLDDGYIAEIHRCWMLAFADYNVDMSYLTIDRMVSRSRMQRVNYNLSVGAFKDESMIGFLIIGIDNINGELCAFDAGTGVVPEFWGQGIAGEMFNFVLPGLKEKEIKSFILEVMQVNKAAIKAYQKANFAIKRSFNCYKINTNHYCEKPIALSNIIIRRVEKRELTDYMVFNDWEVSWEYSLSAILNIQEELLMQGAFINDKCVGFIVYYPTLQWIFMLSVDKKYRRMKIGSLLLAELLTSVSEVAPIVKFNNIPPEHEMCDFLEKQGFELYAAQYEMIADI